MLNVRLASSALSYPCCIYLAEPLLFISAASIILSLALGMKDLRERRNPVVFRGHLISVAFLVQGDLHLHTMGLQPTSIQPGV